MSKKIGKIIIGIMTIILITGGIIYLIDLNRMKNNEPVLFSTWGRKYNPPVIEDHTNTKELISLEDLPNEYSLEQAVKDGCFVITNKLYNKSKLDEFIKNTEINSENRKEDTIRIIKYTIEGDPIIIELSYRKDETNLEDTGSKNKGMYVLKIDNTRDKFATESDRKITVNEDIPGDIYGIMEKEEGEVVKVILALYAEIYYVNENAKSYETIDICGYNISMEQQ